MFELTLGMNDFVIGIFGVVVCVWVVLFQLIYARRLGSLQGWKLMLVRLLLGLATLVLGFSWTCFEYAVSPAVVVGFTADGTFEQLSTVGMPCISKCTNVVPAFTVEPLIISGFATAQERDLKCVLTFEVADYTRLFKTRTIPLRMNSSFGNGLDMRRAVEDELLFVGKNSPVDLTRFNRPNDPLQRVELEALIRKLLAERGNLEARGLRLVRLESFLIAR